MDVDEDDFIECGCRWFLLWNIMLFIILGPKVWRSGAIRLLISWISWIYANWLIFLNGNQSLPAFPLLNNRGLLIPCHCYTIISLNSTSRIFNIINSHINSRYNGHIQETLWREEGEHACQDLNLGHCYNNCPKLQLDHSLLEIFDYLFICKDEKQFL